VLEELRSPEFQNALENIRNLIVNLPPQNSAKDGKQQKERYIDIEYCNNVIPEFSKMVKKPSVNINEVKDMLLDIADTCIDKLTFSYQCLITRGRINSAVSYKTIR